MGMRSDGTSVPDFLMDNIGAKREKHFCIEDRKSNKNGSYCFVSIAEFLSATPELHKLAQ